jgi:hypothetical protein
VADAGRQIHYQWVERASPSFLEATDLAARRRAQLVVFIDVFVCRLLRRALGFGWRQTGLALIELVEARLNGGK